MSEYHIVRNGAPTLAGLKTGSMFTCPYESREAMLSFIRQLNRRLGAKGLKVLPLRFSDTKALIYLYRPAKLSRDLADETAEQILRARGYDTDNCGKCIAQLIRKLRQQPDFPHEIGLFLGYPPEDVRGFIKEGPCGCKCTGCWKVYGDEAAAQKKFDQFKKCTRVYCEQWNKGRELERLTVAG